VPYISKAKLKEREAQAKRQGYFSWFQLIGHIRAADGCSEHEARQQAAEAIGDCALKPKWIDEGHIPLTGTPLRIPWNAPHEYWMNLIVDRDDQDCIIESIPSAPLAKEDLEEFLTSPEPWTKTGGEHAE
jgi:hypothetical protein